jgi:hypothetical protein
MDANPEDKEKNWLATVAGRGYFAILRLYGPTGRCWSNCAGSGLTVTLQSGPMRPCDPNPARSGPTRIPYRPPLRWAFLLITDSIGNLTAHSAPMPRIFL